jgi:hypothetical protein
MALGTNPLLADCDNDDPLDSGDCMTCGPQSWWRFKLTQSIL